MVKNISSSSGWLLQSTAVQVFETKATAILCVISHQININLKDFTVRIRATGSFPLVFLHGTLVLRPLEVMIASLSLHISNN
uniref:Uncharacterized protein n=1 Tax=Anguilla anguilla TaxID=7936 RepID=A0A0E9XT46_ANGAN